MSLLVQPQTSVDYTKKAVPMPLYKMRKLVPASQPTLSVTATETTVFEIPANLVMNLPRSIFDFDVTLPSPGVSTGPTADLMNFLDAQGQTCLDRIQVTTELGQNLLEIGNLQAYQKTVLPLIEPAENWRTKNASYSNGLAPVPGLSTFQGLEYDGTILNNAPVPYWSPQQVRTEGKANLDQTTHFSIPLNKLVPHSFLSIAQDIVMPQKLIITLTWARAGSWSFVAKTDGSGVGVIPSAPVISNLALYLAVQQNMSIVQELSNQIATQGLRINYCNPSVTSESTATQTNYSHVDHHNISKGKALLRSYHTLMVNEGDNSIKKHLHGSGTLTNIRTSVNSKYDSDYSQTPSVYYSENRELFEGGIVGLPDFLNSCFAIVQDFSGKKLSELPENENAVEGGLSLAQPVDTAFECVKNNTARTYYAFHIYQKVLNLSPSGVEVSVM